MKRGTITQKKTGGKLFESYFPDIGQLIYDRNRKDCSAKFNLDDEMEFILKFWKTVALPMLSVVMPNAMIYLKVPLFLAKLSTTISI